MRKVEQWGVIELGFDSNEKKEAFWAPDLKAIFRLDNKEISVNGFYDDCGKYKIRFMPEEVGVWTYETYSINTDLDGVRGEFECITSVNNKGIVSVSNVFHFKYSNGERYIPIGTTCYAWIYQDEEMKVQTVRTLEDSPYNKIRMCVFPKWYEYNRNEPDIFPFKRREDGSFDKKQFDVHFFEDLEKQIIALASIGVEVDLILFHPYDKWGFSGMSKEEDEKYLNYITARLGAYRNIWWSLANEYDLFGSKTIEDWNELIAIVTSNDPYKHLCSIHNCFGLFDHTNPLLTHASIQRVDRFRTSENTDLWRTEYEKPIVIDEVGYEGDLNHGWGNLTPEELVRRFWEGYLRGGYVTHGETYYSEDEHLWWSHGGILKGTSTSRIQFLKEILVDKFGEEITPLTAKGGEGEQIFNAWWDVTCCGSIDSEFMMYFGINQPKFRRYSLDTAYHYEIELIDTWNMTISKLDGTYSGDFEVALSGKPYMLVYFTRIK